MIKIDIKVLASIFSMYQKGDLVCSLKTTTRIKAGERGVVISSKHQAGKSSRYIVVFEKGGIMLVDSQKTSICIASLQAHTDSLGDYHYRDILTATQDYLAGRFSEAFNNKLLLLKFNQPEVLAGAIEPEHAIV